MYNRNRLLADTTILTVSSVVTLLISIIQAKVMAMYFLTTDVGLYSQVNITSNLLISFFVLGLPGTPQFFIPRAKDNAGKKSFISQLLFLYNIIGFAATIVVAIMMPYIVSFYGNPALNECAVILILQPWVKLFESAYCGIMVACGKARQTTWFSFAKAGIMLGFLLIVINSHISIIHYIYLNFFVEAAFDIFMLIIIIRSVHGVKLIYVNKPLLKSIFKFAIPLAISGLVGTLCIETDKLFVTRFYDTSQLGIYTYVAKELPLAVLPNAFLAVSLPIIVKLIGEHMINRAMDLWKKIVEFSAFIMFFAVAALIAFSREIIIILYSEEYIVGQSVFIVYAIVLLMRITFFGIMLKAKGETKSILYCSILTLILNVVLNSVLQRILGMLGFAFGTLLSIFAGQMAQLVLTSKHLGIRLVNVFPWKKLLKTLMLNACFGIGMYASNKYITTLLNTKNVLYSALIGVAWLVIYFVVIRGRMQKVTYEMKQLQSFENNIDKTEDGNLFTI